MATIAMTRPAAEPGETPEATVARIEAAARIERTPCGSGEMVWHIWGAAGPAVVMTHGSFGSWTHWLHNIEALSRHFRVIIPDTPGMGGSAPPPRPYSAETLAEIISDGLDIVLPGAEPFDLVGFSFGGIIGGHVVVRQQARCRSFTVIGSNALGLRFGDKDPFRSPNRSMSADEIKEVHRHNLAIQMFGDAGKIDELAVHLQNDNTRRARIRSSTIPRTDALTRKLREITCPIRAIWGGRDATAGPYLDDRRRLFLDIRPDCPFHVVEGAGHWVAFEAPDEVSAKLLEWLRPEGG